MNNSPHPDPARLADDLLDEVAQAKRSRRRPWQHVPFLLRSPELMALAPPVRAQVLLHARRSAITDPKIILALLLWAAAIIAAMALLFKGAPSRIGALLALGWIPAFLIHTVTVRRNARRLARGLA